MGRSGPVILTEAKKALDDVSFPLEGDEEPEENQDDDVVTEKDDMEEVEQEFWEAAKQGDEAAMKKILSENSSINVNWKNEKVNGFTTLHCACDHGYDKIVVLLLAHAEIDVNQKNKYGATPFRAACSNGKTSCVQLLLKDARVQVNEPNNDGTTPLRWAARGGRLDIVKWWIASGREMDLGLSGNKKTDVIGAARKPKKYKNETEEAFEERKKVATLLEKLKANSAQTRQEVRKELGITGECAFLDSSFILFSQLFSN